jgi:LysR family pca operon transcriptional activator
VSRKTYSLLQQRLRIRQLRVAVAIAEHGSVLKAAQSLGLTQPATTRSLLDLEDYLGVRIFNRLPRGVSVTRHGEPVLARARRILSEVDRIPDDLALIETGLAQTVIIGVLPSAATGLLPQVLSRFQGEHPEIVVQVVEGRTHELLALLASGKVDLILGQLYEPAVHDSFHREPLYHEPLAILGREGHPIFLRKRIEARQLSAWNFVLPTLSQRIGQDVDRAIHENGIAAQSVSRANSMSMIREMLLATDYLTILSQLTLVGDLIRGSLRGLPIRIVTGPRPGGIILRTSGEVPKSVETLRGVLQTCVSELIETGYLGRYPD